MYEILYGEHELKTWGYNLGDRSWVRLCHACAVKLDLTRCVVPRWYPKKFDEDISLRDCIIKYAKNNPHVEKIIKRRITCLKGLFFSFKNGKQIKFDSRLEREHLYFMEDSPDIVKFDRGPRIPYFDYVNYNRERKYYVDWKICYKNGNIKLVETKPLSYIEVGLAGNSHDSFIPKLEAVEDYCAERGYKFEMWI